MGKSTLKNIVLFIASVTFPMSKFFQRERNESRKRSLFSDNRIYSSCIVRAGYVNGHILSKISKKVLATTEGMLDIGKEHN